MRAERFEELVRAIYGVTREGAFSKDFGLRDQIQRAAVSVMSNIAEGFERGSRADFHHFVVIAKASCAEVRSQLYIAFDVGYLDEDTLGGLLEQTGELGKILGGLRASLSKDRTE